MKTYVYANEDCLLGLREFILLPGNSGHIHAFTFSLTNIYWTSKTLCYAY